VKLSPDYQFRKLPYFGEKVNKEIFSCGPNITWFSLWIFQPEEEVFSSSSLVTFATSKLARPVFNSRKKAICFSN